MSNQNEKRSVEFTLQERNQLLEILDAYTKAQGLNGASKALYFADKLFKAFQPQKVHELKQEAK